jgi:CheY-like chemotaxis protein/predicted DNA-binding protein (UPF0251 family)
MAFSATGFCQKPDMNLTIPPAANLGPEGDFVVMVRDVLEHLYDYAYLQTHPLAGRIQAGKVLTPHERARFLRTMILKTTEEMHPGPVPFRSVRARTYNVLNLHYVEGLTIQEVARELAVSERQCYRDLRKAEEDLAAVLWANHVPAVPEGDEVSREDLVLREAERISPNVEEVDLEAFLDGAVDSIRPLAASKGVRLDEEVGGCAGAVRADRLLARQALVSALSHAVQNAQPNSTVSLTVSGGPGVARLRIHYTAQEDRRGAQEPLVAAQQLVGRFGGEWEMQADASGQTTMAFTLGQRAQTRILVIDDNAGLIELFRRYLSGEDYEVVGARDGQEGIRLAEECRPGIIVLDVMMPQQDGWEVLQRLRAQAPTKEVPIVICSVLNDPELAFSLGAADFLAKPVSRGQLLGALSRCL